MQIGGLDEFEHITLLGKYLGSLSIEPLLGKMLLVSSLLGCLDPMLIVSCTMAYRDPFVLPTNASLRAASSVIKKNFARGHPSDHFALIHAFHDWRQARESNRSFRWCSDNFVSEPTMLTIASKFSLAMTQTAVGLFMKLAFRYARPTVRPIGEPGHCERWDTTQYERQRSDDGGLMGEGGLFILFLIIACLSFLGWLYLRQNFFFTVSKACSYPTYMVIGCVVCQSQCQ